MHELSIALGIVKIAEAETAKANAKSVEKIELLIGSLSGVELGSLKYVWSTATKNTVLENAQLDIEYLVAKAKCLECETVFKMNYNYDNCPKCKSYFKEILKGKELKVIALEVIG